MQLRPRLFVLACLAQVFVLDLVATTAPAHAARQTRKVSGTSVVGSDVALPNLSSRKRISPDGRWIVWIQDAEVDHVHALWAVPRSGGVPKRMSANLPPGGVFNDVQFSPDSRFLLYSAEQETLDRYDLYSVPLDGTAADGVKLTPPSAASGAFNFKPSASGNRVVFHTFETLASGHSLFSVPIDGSAPALGLDGPYGTGGSAGHFQLVGNQIVFGRQQTSNDPEELWRVPILGPATAGVRLTPGFSNRPGVDSLSLEIAPDGVRVAFLADDSSTRGDELWIAAANGGPGSAIKLASVVAGGAVRSQTQFTPDSSRIVFLADLEVDEKEELFSVATDGMTPPVKLNTALIAVGDVSHFDLSADGTIVVFVADWAIDGRGELFEVPTVGPAVAGQRLNRTLVAGESVAGALPRDDLILYTIVVENALRELRSVPRGGPASAEVPVLIAQTQFKAPFTLPGGHVVAVADPNAAGVFALWSAPIDGSAAPEDLEHPLWGTVTYGSSVAGTPDDEEIFFLAAIGDGPLHLWVTRVDGSQFAPTRLSPVPVTGGNVIDQPFEVTPDGRGVLFEADADVNGREELFLADETRIFADGFESGDLSGWGS